MSSTSEINAKFKSLAKRGVNLGSKTGNEQPEHSGGRLQEYEHGNIYWHRNTGAHEVHGGILAKYLREGGPGQNPRTGRRHFGYPVSDEERTHEGLIPKSTFEFGKIVFFNGGKTLHGDFFKGTSGSTGEGGRLGYPLTEPINVAGGQAVYFERGCLWKGPASEGAIISCLLQAPLLGNPKIVELPDGGVVEGVVEAQWQVPDALNERILRAHGLTPFIDIWKDRLIVHKVAKPTVHRDQIPLVARGPNIIDFSQVKISFDLPNTGLNRPHFRTLYDLSIVLPDGKVETAAPHAFYMAKDWNNFGFMHVTDIHVAERNDQMVRDLKTMVASGNRDLAEAEANFTNFNDNFREFISYANHLHEVGQLDVILATGDLVDFVYNSFSDKGRKNSNHNFRLFERIVLGKSRSPDQIGNEELRVPIFTLFGNHDYRLNPYHLLFKLDIPDLGIGFLDREIGNFSAFHLTEKETRALQGGRPELDRFEAARALEVDLNNQAGQYNYYRNRINGSKSYTVTMGLHQICMIDTGSDANISDGGFIDHLFDENEDRQRLIGGSPNLVGIQRSDINLLNRAIGRADAQGEGLIVVGMHGPPLNIEDTELAHYFRETEHPTIDGTEVDAFLARNDAAGSADWPRTGTRHFKTGTVENKLDHGVANDSTGQFLRVCAGVGPRAVDLVLCGHNHDRVEFRLELENDEMKYFMDHYFENPDSYYASKKVNRDTDVHIRIRDGAQVNGNTISARDNRFDPPMEFLSLDVPPYDSPLNDVSGPRIDAQRRNWWKEHRPLIVQSAALGPMDNSQRARILDREDPTRKITEKPNRSFQGFRFFEVKKNVIAKSRYITLSELRENNYVMPWEDGADDGAIVVGPLAPA